jgi:hypothetical protein
VIVLYQEVGDVAHNKGSNHSRKIDNHPCQGLTGKSFLKQQRIGDSYDGLQCCTPHTIDYRIFQGRVEHFIMEHLFIVGKPYVFIGGGITIPVGKRNLYT